MPIQRIPSGSTPPPPPPPPPPTSEKPADAPKPVTIDIPIPGHKGGVSQLSLPFLFSTGGNGAAASPQQVLGGANGIKSTIGGTNGTLVAAKQTKGTIEAIKQIKSGQAEDTSNGEVVKTKIEEAGNLSNSLKIAGGLGGAIGLATNGINLVAGLKELAGGDEKQGGLKIAASGLGLVANVGSVAGGVVAGATIAKVGKESALMKGAGAVSKTLGKISGPLTIASGALQTVTALTKHPPDAKTAALGGVITAGGVAMCFPPVGSAIGGALVVGAALVQNWGLISHTAEGVAHIVTGTAEEAGHAIAHGAEDVGHAIGSAAHDVASALGL